jgi:hypothetical protein
MLTTCLQVLRSYASLTVEIALAELHAKAIDISTGQRFREYATSIMENAASIVRRGSAVGVLHTGEADSKVPSMILTERLVCILNNLHSLEILFEPVLEAPNKAGGGLRSAEVPPCGN